MTGHRPTARRLLFLTACAGVTAAAAAAGVLMAAAVVASAFVGAEPEPVPTVYAVPHIPDSYDDEVDRAALRQAQVSKRAQEARRVALARRSAAAASRSDVRPHGGVWAALADCESGKRTSEGRVIPGSARWDLDTGNGYSGGLQFAPKSWRDVGGQGMPHEASPAEQVHRGRLLQRLIGWRRGWPACSRRLGL